MAEPQLKPRVHRRSTSTLALSVCKRPAHPSSCCRVLTSSRIISCHSREFLNIMRCGLHWSRPLRPRGRWMVDVRLGWSESQHQDGGSGFCGARSAGSKPREPFVFLLHSPETRGFQRPSPGEDRPAPILERRHRLFPLVWVGLRHAGGSKPAGTYQCREAKGVLL